MHQVPLITTIAAAFNAAWVLGLITQRLKLSPIVGYLLAGIAIGPHTPGIVGDTQLAQQLAEIGVILLMFGVGLHFDLADLLAVRKVAIPGAIGQSTVATLPAVGIAALFDWPPRSGVVLGMAMSVAGTVVLMRVLMNHNLLDTVEGHVAVGRLIVEDIFTVLVLVLIPALAAEGRQAIYGDGYNLEVLGTALPRATHLVITVPNAESRSAMISAIRRLKPDLKIFARIRYIAQKAEWLEGGADAVCCEEEESAVALARLVLREQGADTATIMWATTRIRREILDDRMQG